MGNYSIKELEKLSGIKAHTIRIWEKRHEIIRPTRSATNIRSYSDEDLKKLLNVSILNQYGVKISKIADLSVNELVNRVSELSTNNASNIDTYIDQLTICMVELDEAKFENLLSKFIVKFGFESTMTEIVYPFLQKIGVLWLSNNINPVQEHFITNLIRQKMIVAIDGLERTQDPKAKKVILYLPENELHELGLLFIHYLVKRHGLITYYFGQTVPFSDLEQSCKTLKPDLLITSISYISSNDALEDYLNELSGAFSDIPVYMTGKPVNIFGKKLPQNIFPFKMPSDILNLIN